MRVFAALELPPPLKAELGGKLERLAETHPQFRWTDEEKLHITLLFMGELDARQLTLFAEAVEEAARSTESIHIRAGEARTLPAGKAARVLALSFQEGGEKIAALAARIERNLVRRAKYEACPFPAREKRPFTPHITIARKRGDCPAFFPAPLLAPGEGGALVERVVIYESRLLRAGAEYTAIAAFTLRAC
ncbi:MAG: RNA 2',3'-cyclic phosphodiesterase [Spirochaetaceae bacterium]|jgi:2'-5' RNA ligase|nr:RNA 2',3'-cyclic phosphodiesterase [Spirochaetaceae bacterium]